MTISWGEQRVERAQRMRGMAPENGCWVVEKLVEVRWMLQSAKADENERWWHDKRLRHRRTRRQMRGGREAAKGREAEVEHAAGGGQSIMTPPWFCDELGAWDRCRGHLLFRKPLKHCLLELMTFHWPLLFVCLLNYLHACQRTFRIYKNDHFWVFSGCGTSPSLLRFCGTLVLSTWTCTIPLRRHIPSILPFCFEPSFVVPPSDSDRQRREWGSSH